MLMKTHIIALLEYTVCVWPQFSLQVARPYVQLSALMFYQDVVRPISKLLKWVNFFTELFKYKTGNILLVNWTHRKSMQDLFDCQQMFLSTSSDVAKIHDARVFFVVIRYGTYTVNRFLSYIAYTAASYYCYQQTIFNEASILVPN